MLLPLNSYTILILLSLLEGAQCECLCIELPDKFQKFYFVNNLPHLSMTFCVIDTLVRFLSPAHEVGAGDIVITMSGRAAMRLCVPCFASERYL